MGGRQQEELRSKGRQGQIPQGLAGHSKKLGLPKSRVSQGSDLRPRVAGWRMDWRGEGEEVVRRVRRLNRWYVHILTPGT